MKDILISNLTWEIGTILKTDGTPYNASSGDRYCARTPDFLLVCPDINCSIKLRSQQLNANITKQWLSDNIDFLVYFYNDNKEYISRIIINNNDKFTIPEKCFYIKIVVVYDYAEKSSVTSYYPEGTGNGTILLDITKLYNFALYRNATPQITELPAKLTTKYNHISKINENYKKDAYDNIYEYEVTSDKELTSKDTINEDSINEYSWLYKFDYASPFNLYKAHSTTLVDTTTGQSYSYTINLNSTYHHSTTTKNSDGTETTINYYLWTLDYGNDLEYSIGILSETTDCAFSLLVKSINYDFILGHYYLNTTLRVMTKGKTASKYSLARDFTINILCTSDFNITNEETIMNLDTTITNVALSESNVVNLTLVLLNNNNLTVTLKPLFKNTSQVIKWGDNTTDTILANSDESISHTYETSGEYNIVVSSNYGTARELNETNLFVVFNNYNRTKSDTYVTKVSLPNSCLTIEDEQYNNLNISDINLPYHLNVKKDNVNGLLNNCSYLTSVKLPEKNNTIEGLNNSFANNTVNNSVTVNIPNNITLINNSINNSNINNLTIDGNITSNVANTNVICNCSELENVNINGLITNASKLSLLCNCPNLITANINSQTNNAITIGNAYNNCSNLQSITVNENTSFCFNNDSFNNSFNKSTINISNNITVKSNCFNNCGFTNVNFNGNLTLTDDKSFMCNNANLENLTLTSNVTITDKMIKNNPNLKNLVIGTNVNINNVEDFLSDCPNLDTLKIDTTNNLTDIQKGFLNFTSDNVNVGLTELDLSKYNKLISIGSNSVNYLSVINHIKLPNNLVSIQDNSFSNLPELTTVTFKSNNPTNISNTAFINCPKLTNIEGLSQTYVEEWANEHSIPFTDIYLTTVNSQFNNITIAEEDELLSDFALEYIDSFNDTVNQSHTELNELTRVTTINNSFNNFNTYNLTLSSSNITTISNSFNNCVGLNENLNLTNTNSNVNISLHNSYCNCDDIKTLCIGNNVDSYDNLNTCFKNCSNLNLVKGNLNTNVQTFAEENYINFEPLIGQNYVLTIKVPEDNFNLIIPNLFVETDNNNIATLFTIKWGDGTEEQLKLGLYNSTDSITFNHTYVNSGTYNIEIVNEDNIITDELFWSNKYSDFRFTDTYKDYEIDSDGKLLANCFRNLITKIIIPYGITTIRTDQFVYIYNLEEVVLPNTITTIGEGAFKHIDMSVVTGDEVEMQTNKHIKVNIPKYVKYIEGESFAKNKSITSFTVTKDLVAVKDMNFVGAFSESGIATITFDDNFSVDSLSGYSIFKGCPITTLNLPNKLRLLSGAMFAQCNSLTTVNLPSDLVSLPSSIFEDCISLTNVTLPSTLTTLGSLCFASCTSLTLTDSVLPSGITVLPRECFRDCKSIVNLNLDNITTLGDSCLSGCTSLATITVSNNLNKLGTSCLSDCTSLTTVDLTDCTEITEIPNGFFSGSAITSLMLPTTITKLGYSSFKSCLGLTSVNLPNNLTSIGENCFEACTNIETITISSEIDTINSYAFKDCSKLISVTFTNAGYIKALKNSAFYNCTLLSSLTLPDGLETIEASAFSNCSKLEIITIPSTIKSYSKVDDKIVGLSLEAFKDCTGLKTLKILSKDVVLDNGTLNQTIGYDNSGNKIEGFKFICYKDSTTYTYATNYGFDVELIDE